MSHSSHPDGSAVSSHHAKPDAAAPPFPFVFIRGRAAASSLRPRTACRAALQRRTDSDDHRNFRYRGADRGDTEGVPVEVPPAGERPCDGDDHLHHGARRVQALRHLQRRVPQPVHAQEAGRPRGVRADRPPDARQGEDVHPVREGEEGCGAPSGVEGHAGRVRTTENRLLPDPVLFEPFCTVRRSPSGRSSDIRRSISAISLPLSVRNSREFLLREPAPSVEYSTPASTRESILCGMRAFLL